MADLAGTESGTESEAANVELVEAFWAALDRRDFAAVGSMMSERGHYIDVPLVGGEEARSVRRRSRPDCASGWSRSPPITCTPARSWPQGTW